MKIRRKINIACVIALHLLFSNYALATIMPELSIEEMTKRSSLVIVGKVESVTGKWNAENTTILTHAIISPKTFLIGNSEKDLLVIELLGGTVDSLTTTAVGEASLNSGEEVVLFLTQNTKGQSESYRIVGHAQGKFRIIKSHETNRMLVERDLNGINFISNQSSSIPKYFDDLVEQIKNLK